MNFQELRHEHSSSGIDVLEFLTSQEKGSGKTSGNGIEIFERVTKEEEDQSVGNVVDIFDFAPMQEREVGKGLSAEKEVDRVLSGEVVDVAEISSPQGGNVCIPGPISIRTQNNFCVALPQTSYVKEIPSPGKGAFQKIVKAEDCYATNFTVRPIRQFVFLDREGNEDFSRSIITCEVRLEGNVYEIEIKVPEIGSLAKIIQQRFPQAILDFEENKAEKMLEMKFRKAMQQCEKTYTYFQAGWQSINGAMRYLYDGIRLGAGMEVRTGMTMPTIPYSDANILLAIFEKSMSVYQEGVAMSVIFVFSLLGVLYRPFREAGIPPHFTLFLYGITGSMKTTIAKILFVQMCDDRFRENVRRIDADTAVSLERAIVSSGQDTVTLIDDFSPAKTKAKKSEMNEKLEMIIRMVGDGSSRSRSSVNLEDRRGEGVQGMVALTGELRGKGLSSNLRCLYCKMEKEKADEEMITWFQENPYAYTTLIAAFADYVGVNYRVVVNYIRENIKMKRRETGVVLKEYRLVDSATVLCLAAHIFKGFLLSACRMPEKDAEEWIKRWEGGIMQCAIKSQIISTEESPGVVFIQAVAALMRVNKIVVNTEKVKMSEVTAYDGFEDDTFLYFNPESVHKKVVAFLSGTNCYFPYESKEVQAILADEGIIKTAPNGMNKRTYCVRIPTGNGRKQNFLKIRKAIFQSICEDIFDHEKGERN